MQEENSLKEEIISGDIDRQTSFFNEFINYSMNKSTSHFGRLQFSVEKANNVKLEIPNLALVSTVTRTDFVPFSWPKALSKPFCFAQRPLPSIIIARCLGKLFKLILSFQFIYFHNNIV